MERRTSTSPPRDPQFIAEYQRALDGRAIEHLLKVQDLIRSFRNCSSYKALSRASQRDYDRYLTLIENEFGKVPVSKLEEPTTRGMFICWRERFSSSPRKADYIWSVLSALLSHGLNLGLISRNPCLRGGRLYRSTRRDSIWSEVPLQTLKRCCSREIWAAVQLGLWTGQRQKDLLTVTWSQICDGRILFLQSKTRARVAVPIASPLAETLESLPRTCKTILMTGRGTSWTSDGFRSSFRHACEKAGLRNLTFHDLRGTAITRMALAGCTSIQIAAVTGHSIATIGQILSDHYIGDQSALADLAMEKLRESYPNSK